MKNIDIESFLNYTSLILAIAIFLLVIYSCFFKITMENFESDEKTGETKKDEKPKFVPAKGKAIVSGVSAVNIKDGGSDFDEESEIVFSKPEDEKGIEAKGKLILDEDEVKNIKITNPGKGYKKPPKISVKGSGKDLDAEVVLGAVSHIEITNKGMGYGSTPQIDFGITPANGTSARATARINVNTGEVNGVTINNGGIGYKDNFEVKFQTPKASENTINPYVSLGDKKEEILSLLKKCSKISEDKKAALEKNIKKDKLREHDVDEIIDIISKK